MLDEDFVPYDESMELKKLGFDEPCYEAYNIDGNGGESGIPAENYHYRLDVISRPTISQAFRWFRENFNVFVSPNVISYSEGPRLWFFELNSTALSFGTDLGETDDYVRYEEAELACLRKLIKIAKDQK